MIKSLTATALALVLAASPAAAATLVGSYGFDGTLASAQPGGATLGLIDPTGTSGFGSDTVFGQTRSVFNFAGNAGAGQSGLTFDASGLTANSYSVALTFKFNEGDGNWRRILGVADRQSDDGFYVNRSNNLAVFPTAGSNVDFVSGEYRNVVLTVDGTNVSAFVDGGASFTAISNVMNLANGPGKLTFFADNVVGGGGGEWASGSIAALRIYNGVLSGAEIAELNRVPFVAAPVPEPATWAMMIAGFGLIGGALRRKGRTLAAA